MSYKDDEEYIKSYTDNLIKFYNEHCVIQNFTTIKQLNYEYIANMKNIITIGKKYILTNFMEEKDRFFVLHSFIQGLINGEFQFIINRLKNNDDNIDKYEDHPTKKTIDNSIQKIEYYKPDFMIVPINFFVKMHEWGMRQTYRNTNSTIIYEKGGAFYRYNDLKIRIIWSNKWIKLSEIIIGSKITSKWYYTQDKDTKDRITLQIMPKDSDGILEIKSTFVYEPPPAEAISIIKFPESITKIE